MRFLSHANRKRAHISRPFSRQISTFRNRRITASSRRNCDPFAVRARGGGARGATVWGGNVGAQAAEGRAPPGRGRPHSVSGSSRHSGGGRAPRSYYTPLQSHHSFTISMWKLTPRSRFRFRAVRQCERERVNVTLAAPRRNATSTLIARGCAPVDEQVSLLDLQ